MEREYIYEKRPQIKKTCLLDHLGSRNLLTEQRVIEVLVSLVFILRRVWLIFVIWYIGCLTDPLSCNSSISINPPFSSSTSNSFCKSYY